MQGLWHFQLFNQRMPRRDQLAQQLALYQFEVLGMIEFWSLKTWYRCLCFCWVLNVEQLGKYIHYLVTTHILKNLIFSYICFNYQVHDQQKAPKFFSAPTKSTTSKSYPTPYNPLQLFLKLPLETLPSCLAQLCSAHPWKKDPKIYSSFQRNENQQTSSMPRPCSAKVAKKKARKCAA